MVCEQGRAAIRAVLAELILTVQTKQPSVCPYHTHSPWASGSAQICGPRPSSGSKWPPRRMPPSCPQPEGQDQVSPTLGCLGGVRKLPSPRGLFTPEIKPSSKYSSPPNRYSEGGRGWASWGLPPTPGHLPSQGDRTFSPTGSRGFIKLALAKLYSME